MPKLTFERGAQRKSPGFTYRIRRVLTRRSTAWCLVPLRDDGTEISDHRMTAKTIDDLLDHSKGLLPMPEDHVQIVYYYEEGEEPS